ncbi:MAG: FoF1 ATP synthase subunit gamma [Sulfitobacter sp.]
MAQTLETLTRRTDTLQSIRSIVHTMKTLSAINAVPYENASRAIDTYHATVLRGFRAFLHHNGPLAAVSNQTATHVLIAFGSDHGLCGNYNEVLAAEVLANPIACDTTASAPRILCVGAQMNDALLGRGARPESVFLPSASADGIGRLASDIVTHLDEIRCRDPQREIAVTLGYTRRAPQGLQLPVCEILLPLAPDLLEGLADSRWNSRSLPDFTLPADVLLAALIRSHLFASVFRAAAEALVTENAARLAQMQQAEQSVDDRLEVLKADTRAVRQTEITNELMDVVIGFEALRGRIKKSKGTAA